MRRTGCRYRGPIALIRKGSGQVVGTAEVVDSLQAITTATEYADAESKHGIPPARQKQAFEDGWRTPWVLQNAQALPVAVPYSHPSGAVIWVNLDEKVAAVVVDQLRAGKPPMSVHRAVKTHAARTSEAQAKRTGTTREVTVTGGNLRNRHLYLPLDFFPQDAIGGGNKGSAGAREITVAFHPGATVRTDIDRTKRILRDRSAISDFFVRASISEGDRILITRTASHTFHFERA